ncbi:hypothetical protein NLI96_g8022 [Meripilus lineatus]|uniref:Uncharacterized protein n=1 Tax=Meripilus lineatus TaxID=2056292 RepID=A0AAD5YGL4_9APHY|nr:hypothetical protein NLI96_g8022 [Physisporinus lineatus]
MSRTPGALVVRIDRESGDAPGVSRSAQSSLVVTGATVVRRLTLNGHTSRRPILVAARVLVPERVVTNVLLLAIPALVLLVKLRHNCAASAAVRYYPSNVHIFLPSGQVALLTPAPLVAKYAARSLLVETTAVRRFATMANVNRVLSQTWPNATAENIQRNSAAAMGKRRSLKQSTIMGSETLGRVDFRVKTYAIGE